MNGSHYKEVFFFKAVAYVLGPGKTQNVSKEEIYLIRDVTVRINASCSNILQWRWSIFDIISFSFVLTTFFFFHFLQQTDIDSLLVNFRIEATYLKENFNIQWVSETGMVENIEQITEEYKQARGLLVRWNTLAFLILPLCWRSELGSLTSSNVLQYNHCLYVSQPLRICILGPPAVGKSTIAERICKHYKLHHVKLKETITETLENLVSGVQQQECIHNYQSMFI